MEPRISNDSPPIQPVHILIIFAITDNPNRNWFSPNLSSSHSYQDLFVKMSRKDDNSLTDEEFAGYLEVNPEHLQVAASHGFVILSDSQSNKLAEYLKQRTKGKPPAKSATERKAAAPSLDNNTAAHSNTAAFRPDASVPGVASSNPAASVPGVFPPNAAFGGGFSFGTSPKAAMVGGFSSPKAATGGGFSSPSASMAGGHSFGSSHTAGHSFGRLHGAAGSNNSKRASSGSGNSQKKTRRLDTHHLSQDWQGRQLQGSSSLSPFHPFALGSSPFTAEISQEQRGRNGSSDSDDLFQVGEKKAPPMVPGDALKAFKFLTDVQPTILSTDVAQALEAQDQPAKTALYNDINTYCHALPAQSKTALSGHFFDIVGGGGLPMLYSEPSRVLNPYATTHAIAQQHVWNTAQQGLLAHLQGEIAKQNGEIAKQAKAINSLTEFINEITAPQQQDGGHGADGHASV